MSEAVKTPSIKPVLGRPVIVITAKPINGQTEHAAVITQVVSDQGEAHVTVLPAGALPYPVLNIAHEKMATKGAICWRWPSK